MLEIEVNASKPSCKSPHDGNGKGLAEGLKEFLVQLPICLAGDQGSKRRRLCAHPGNRNGLNCICQTERHSHLARLHWTPKCKQNRIENPKQEVPGEPAYSNSPLERPDFLAPQNPMCSNAVPQ